MKKFFEHVFKPQIEEMGESTAVQVIKDLKEKLSLRTNETLPIIKADAIIEFLRIYKDAPKERFITDWFLANSEVILESQLKHILSFMNFEEDFSAANLMSMLENEQRISFIEYTLKSNNDV